MYRFLQIMPENDSPEGQTGLYTSPDSGIGLTLVKGGPDTMPRISGIPATATLIVYRFKNEPCGTKFNQ
jgi:hypothetical protein